MNKCLLIVLIFLQSSAFAKRNMLKNEEFYRLEERVSERIGAKFLKADWPASLKLVRQNMYFDLFETNLSYFDGVALSFLDVRVRRGTSEIELISLNFSNACANFDELITLYPDGDIHKATTEATEKFDAYYALKRPWGRLALYINDIASDRCVSGLVVSKKVSSKR